MSTAVSHTETRGPLRLLIVEDHPLVAQALSAALTASLPISSLDHASDIASAFAYLRAQPGYRLIVLDLQLPDANGLDVLEQLREEHEQIPVLVFSADNTRDVIERVFEGGARGHVHKSASVPELVGAIEMVLRGENYVSEEAAAVLGAAVTPAHLGGTGASLGREAIRRLSPRQTQILRGLLRGESNKVISRELTIAVGTVKAHANAIYTMFNVSNRAELVARASVLGVYSLLSSAATAHERR